MNLRSIKSSLPILVGLLLEDAREWLEQSGKALSVTFGGDRTSSSGDGQINFQSIPVPTGTADAELAAIVDTYVALAVHEVGHLEHTDFAPFQVPSLERVIANILEDRRVDALQFKRWPGFKATFYRKATVKLRIAQNLVPSPSDTDATTMLNYLLLRSVADQLGHDDCLGFAELAAMEVDRRFGANVRMMLDTHAKLAPMLRSTEESFQAAAELVALLKTAAQEPEESEPERGNDTDDADLPPDADETEAHAEALASESGASQSATDQRVTGNLDQEDECGAEGEQGADSKATEFRKALRAVLEDKNVPDVAELQREAENEELGKSIESAVSSGDVETVTFNPRELQMDGTAQRCLPPKGPMPNLHRIRASTALLRSRMAVLLEAESEADTVRAASGRKLAPSGPRRAMLGDPRVFSRRTDGVSLSTAISILLDVSGSMKDHGRLEIAVEAALAAAMALQPFDEASLAIYSFPGNGCLKHFDESIRSALPKFALSTWGSTPMAEAILIATGELVKRDEARRILVVITDGEPDNAPATRAVVRGMQAAQVECVGIGIQLPTITGIFPCSRVIQSVDQLPQALMATLKNQILAEA